MRILETTFTKYSHQFTQIAREENKALYERTHNGRHICYELIKIKMEGSREINGKVYPGGEYYPGSGEFGKYGWSLIYHSLDKAMLRFNSLNYHSSKGDNLKEENTTHLMINN